VQAMLPEGFPFHQFFITIYHTRIGVNTPQKQANSQTTKGRAASNTKIRGATPKQKQ